MEEYGLDGLAASAESVLAGLGPLAVQLARLAGEAGRAVTLDAMEVLVIGQGRELLRGLVQLALDAQAGREVRLPGVTGEDGVPRTRAEPGHGRPVVTLFGPTHIAWTRTYHPHAIHLRHPVPCGPCQKSTCPLGHHRCMRELTPESVFGAARRYL